MIILCCKISSKQCTNSSDFHSWNRILLHLFIYKYIMYQHRNGYYRGCKCEKIYSIGRAFTQLVCIVYRRYLAFERNFPFALISLHTTEHCVFYRSNKFRKMPRRQFSEIFRCHSELSQIFRLVLFNRFSSDSIMSDLIYYLNFFNL